MITRVSYNTGLENGCCVILPPVGVVPGCGITANAAVSKRSDSPNSKKRNTDNMDTATKNCLRFPNIIRVYLL